MNRVPVCLVTGFLGSGKTTFLRHIIRTHSHKKLAFIVNEFSSLDVDGTLIQSEHEQVICLTGGSVFCKCLSGQFIQTLRDLPQALQIPRCDGVVVEASGMADPGVARKMLFETGLNFLYTLSVVVAVVDPGNIRELIHKLPNSRTQLLAADTILLNKQDVYGEKEMNSAVEAVAVINPRAHLLRTSQCRVNLDLFGRESALQASGTYAACADPDFATEVVETSDLIDTERLLRAVNTLRESVYRVKGFIKQEAGTLYLDWTPSTATRFELPDYRGKLAFTIIGAGEKSQAIHALADRIRAGAFRRDNRTGTDILFG